MSRASLADTSLFVAIEQDRPLRAAPPASIAVSMITVGELRLGVLMAPDNAVRALRLRTLTRALSFDPLPVDDSVASAWAELRAALRFAGRKMPLNDSWIAATAIAHQLPLATQDDDYDDVPGLEVVKL
ncbi:MAG: type II toxin-antitoxin system VapC family toxin [Pseudonocardiaceae bacterium]